MVRIKYTVEWQRVGEPAHLTCTGLSLRLAMRRLNQVLNASGPIIIHSIRVEQTQ